MATFAVPVPKMIRPSIWKTFSFASCATAGAAQRARTVAVESRQARGPGKQRIDMVSLRVSLSAEGLANACSAGWRQKILT